MKNICKILTAALLFIFPFSISSVTTAQVDLKERFLEFASKQAVTGHEYGMIEYIKGKLPSFYDVTTDNMGNLIAKSGNGDPRVCIMASVDEPGYIVSGIRNDGYLTVHTTSSIPFPLFHKFHEGVKVEIITSNGKVNGVVAIPSSHITRGKGDMTDMNDFIVDIGADSKEHAEEMGVMILDPFTAVKNFAELTNGKISGPVLHSKYPAFAVLEAAHDADRNSSVMFIWTTQHARRNSGAARIAESLKLQKILLISSFLPYRDRRTRKLQIPVCTPGSGLLVPEENTPRNEFPGVVSDILRGNNYKYKNSGTGMLYEYRAFRGKNTQIAPVAIPVEYPHSLVETIDLKDLESLIDLINEVVKK